MRRQRCCFTGHRPNKMELGEKEIKPLLEKAIDEAISAGYRTFITGMAMGTDIWAAEIVLQKKERNQELHLICASPYPGFGEQRSVEEQRRLHIIIEKADLVKEVSPNYFAGCFDKRNRWMVNHSGVVISVFNGKRGGTKNTLAYAKRRGVPIVNVLEF